MVHRFTKARQDALEAVLEKRRNLQKKREALEDEIILVDHAIADADLEYSAVYNEIHENAPMLSLPDEVTGLIFSFSTGFENSSFACCPCSESVAMEVVVSHVCRRWREIAINLPVLWTTYRCAASGKCAPSLDSLDLYLERSSNRLLELSFDFTEGTPTQGDRYTRQIEKILPHSERWLRLHIETWDSAGEPAGMTALLLKFKMLAAPNLIHLSIGPGVYAAPPPNVSTHYTSRGVKNLDPSILLGGVPKLRSLFMEGAAPVSALPPWFNITTLCLTGPQNSTCDVKLTCEAFIELISIPNLVNLSLHGRHVLYRESSWTTNWKAPNLKKLRVGQISTRLLHNLTAPKLETLVVFDGKYIYDPSAIGGVPIADFNVFPSLHSLILDECGMFTVEALIDLALRTPKITHLTISHSEDNWGAFRWLPETLGLWPDLGMITLDIEGFDIQRYLRFVDCPTGPKPLTFIIHRKLIEHWRIECPRELCGLEENVNITTMPENVRLRSRYWPQTEDSPGELCFCSDPFVFDAYHDE